jgi:hypothetical protein
MNYFVEPMPLVGVRRLERSWIGPILMRCGSTNGGELLRPQYRALEDHSLPDR